MPGSSSDQMDAIGRLAGGVAHEYNNLLAVVVSYAELLGWSLDDGDPRCADVAEIRRAAERAAELTQQLLALSKQSVIDPRPLALDAMVDGLQPIWRRALGDHVELRVIDAGVPAVIADRGTLEQALINLIANARDAMPDGGITTVDLTTVELDATGAEQRGLAQPGRYAVVAVTDTGIGMDVETRRRAIEPFFTTRAWGKTTGLGLSVVHGVVEQAGGALTIDSEVGRGSTVRIFLPAAGPAPQAAIAAAPAPVADLAAATVLVVDDDHQVRAVVARILQRAGCTVLQAAGAEEACHLCVTYPGPIDALLGDVMLADGRGDALAIQLATLRPSLRVLLMSGYPGDPMVGRADQPPLLAKPFTPLELRSAVGTLLADRPRGRPITRPDLDERPGGGVLVVDDDRLMRRSIVRMLRAGGLDTDEADSGHEAARLLEARRFDVVVSDLHMPGGGGLDLLRSIRRIDLDIPVVLITGIPDTRSAAEALEHGAFRYLTKPLDLAALDKVVRQAMQAHRLARIRREALTASGASARGAVDRAGLEVRFDSALAELWMAFQPIVEARTGVLYGAEALLRTGEPSMPDPGSVLDAATALGRLTQLGRRVRALSAGAFEARGRGLGLFVNLHPDDLLDADLIAADSPLAQIASRVILEVTERASLRASTSLFERIGRLRELGFRLAVDDIGAGYSGLTSFASLTPEIVKIDMSLVRDAHLSVAKQRTIRSLCNLCHESGSLVVAEGIETPAERDVLLDLGCDLFQGYLFGRPSREMPA